MSKVSNADHYSQQKVLYRTDFFLIFWWRSALLCERR